MTIVVINVDDWSLGESRYFSNLDFPKIAETGVRYRNSYIVRWNFTHMNTPSQTCVIPFHEFCWFHFFHGYGLRPSEYGLLPLKTKFCRFPWPIYKTEFVVQSPTKNCIGNRPFSPPPPPKLRESHHKHWVASGNSQSPNPLSSSTYDICWQILKGINLWWS